MSGRAAAIAALVFVFGATAVAAVALWPREDEREASEPSAAAEAAEPEPLLDPAQVEAYAVDPAPPDPPVRPRLKRPPESGILFDVDTGEVLWAREPNRERPIASLTKMMTALLIAERHEPAERVEISAKAPGVEGSRIGVLRRGSKVPLRGLFLGLIMTSGNDAAAALAEHDAGTIERFVRRMNRRAGEMGLGCTRFAGPAGLQDTGNESCAYDLAALARADLANRWVASITRRRFAKTPFPVGGGTLELANNHFFVQRGVAGLPAARVTGVKTGLTNGAGRCYVTTARLGDRHLGVVLLDSHDPLRQVPILLRAGFKALGASGEGGSVPGPDGP
ncbi:MAG: D-alanyl-D-alanine carboxypeptidase [Actinobacteria bacterium]|nr:D-alanyl-D-alanine carboxypeptidase [Actinomycetota bacterium]